MIGHHLPKSWVLFKCFLFQCVPFWPDTDSMRMYVKFRDSKLVSQHFSITHVHQTVLRMDKGVSIVFKCLAVLLRLAVWLWDEETQ